MTGRPGEPSRPSVLACHGEDANYSHKRGQRNNRNDDQRDDVAVYDEVDILRTDLL